MAQSENKCRWCSKSFSLLLRRHECRPCASKVCCYCSPHKWDKRCIPASRNKKGESTVRVCIRCQVATQICHKAVLGGDIRAARKHFTKYSPLYLQQPSRFVPNLGTCVHAAAQAGSVPLLRWLIEEHACLVDSKCLKGFTPLEVAAEANNFDAMQYLLQKGGSLSSIRNGATARRMLVKAMGRLGEGKAGLRRRSTEASHRLVGGAIVEENAGLDEKDAMAQAEAMSAAVAASLKYQKQAAREKKDRDAVDAALIASSLQSQKQAAIARKDQDAVEAALLASLDQNQTCSNSSNGQPARSAVQQMPTAPPAPRGSPVATFVQPGWAEAYLPPKATHHAQLACADVFEPSGSVQRMQESTELPVAEAVQVQSVDAEVFAVAPASYPASNFQGAPQYAPPSYESLLEK